VSISPAKTVACIISALLFPVSVAFAQTAGGGSSVAMENPPHLAPLERAATHHAAETGGLAPVHSVAVLAKGQEPGTDTQSNDLSLEGTIGYAISGTTLELTADRVSNNRVGGMSGTVRLSLWATASQPFFGGAINGYRMGYYEFTTTLAGGYYFGPVDRFVSFASPPNGTYYVTMTVDEYSSSNNQSVNDGFAYHDLRVFSNLITFGAQTCTPSTTTLCLLNNRFQVTLTVNDPRVSGTGSANATAQGDWGYFDVPAATGTTDKPVIFVKLIDGRPVNQRYWVFYGGLTDIQYTFIVTDKQTGATRTYSKATGTYDGRADTNAFPGN
jgi:hypothetical protein